MADNTLHASTSTQGSWLERRFALYSRGSSVRTECLAGITGFLAAAYLLVVILACWRSAGWIRARRLPVLFWCLSAARC